jgi:hypothetical protein
MCGNLFGPCSGMTPFAKVLSAKLLEVVKRLETSARRAGAGTVMHAAQAVPSTPSAEGRANLWSLCLHP